MASEEVLFEMFNKINADFLIARLLKSFQTASEQWRTGK